MNDNAKSAKSASAGTSETAVDTKSLASSGSACPLCGRILRPLVRGNGRRYYRRHLNCTGAWCSLSGRKMDPTVVRQYPPRLFCVFQGCAGEPVYCGRDPLIALGITTVGNTKARDYHLAEYVPAPNAPMRRRPPGECPWPASSDFLDQIEDRARQQCFTDTQVRTYHGVPEINITDSGGISSRAEMLRTLAARGRFRVVRECGRMVVGYWPENDPNVSGEGRGAAPRTSPPRGSTGDPA